MVGDVESQRGGLLREWMWLVVCSAVSRSLTIESEHTNSEMDSSKAGSRGSMQNGLPSTCTQVTERNILLVNVLIYLFE